MKKNIKWYYICLAILIMGLGLYSNVIKKTFRYDTPEEAFEKTKPDNVDLVDVFVEADVSMIVYVDNNGTFSDKIIFKDSKGWSLLTVVYEELKHTHWNNGYSGIDNVNGKTVITFDHVVAAGENIPKVTDSLGTELCIGTYERDGGVVLISGFGILPDELPEEYTLYIGEQEVVFKDRG